MVPSLHGGSVQVVSCPPSAGLKVYTRALAERADRIRRGLVEPDEDNLLKVTSDGRKASVFNNPPNTWPAPDMKTKLDLCADRVWRHYCESDADSGAQLVFCDLYTPKEDDAQDVDYYASVLTDDERFAAHGVYGRLKGYLVARGIVPDEVAFAHDYDSPRARGELHRLIRSGRVRICIGSTALIGVSVNVQDRGVALHHLDCPWRPDELEQRTKRFVRQGNLYERVHVYVYVTEGSYDPVVWQIVEGKARWISQLLSGRVSRKTVEDVGAIVLTASLAKAVALGDSRVLDKTRIEVELGGLERRYHSWQSSRAALRRDADRLPLQVAQLRRLAERSSLLAERVCRQSEEGFGLWLDDPNQRRGAPVSVPTLQDGNAVVRALWLQHSGLGRLQSAPIGAWRGFRLWFEPRGGVLELAAYPDGELPDGTGVSVSGVGFHANRAVDALGQKLDREWLLQEARHAEGRARALGTRLESVRQELAERWTMRPEIERLLAEYEQACAGRPADMDGETVVREALEPLLDKVSFRFRWE